MPTPAEQPPSPRQPHSWGIVLWFALAVLALVLGAWGFGLHPEGARLQLPDLLFRAFQLFLLNSGAVEPPVPWQLELARLLALLLLGTALFRLLHGFLSEHGQRLRLALRARGHVVLCGLGWKARLYAAQFRRQGRFVVVLEKDAQNPLIDGCRDLGAVVLLGDATRPGLLQRARVDRASLLLCLCDDLTNVDVALAAEQLLDARGTHHAAYTCFVHVLDPFLCRSLQEAELARPGRSYRREFFSVFEVGARVLRAGPLFKPFLQPARKGAPIHLLLLGLEGMGVSLLFEVLRFWRSFCRSLEQRDWPETPRLRLTLVDPAATAKRAALGKHFQHLEDVCELRVQDQSWSPLWLDQGDYAVEHLGEPAPTLACVCAINEQVAVHLALRLHRRWMQAGKTAPVILQLSGNEGVQTLLTEAPAPAGLSRFQVFSLFENVCRPEQLIGFTELIARGIHKHYLDQQQARGMAMGSKPALRDWEHLEERFRRSNLDQAQKLSELLNRGTKHRYQIVRLRNFRADEFEFDADDLRTIAKNEHERYRSEPGRQGDRQSAMETWEELSAENQERTLQQVRDWPKILALHDFEIQRSERPGGA